MKQLNKLWLAAIFLWSSQGADAQCGGSINFSTDWAKKGPAAAGTWNVSGGGSTVTQTINGAPTFYVSGTNYIDVRIHGTFEVNTTNDDDWVGFVFGYNDPLTPADNPVQNYYLFDWKQTNQAGTGGSCYTMAEEGFSLVKVDTSLNLNDACAVAPLYWDHNSYPGFDVMATQYGAAYGWADNVEYDFTLTYTSSVIIIEIEGDTIFNVPGCYEPGRFGFYNLSQDQSVYSNFTYELIADFDMSVNDACVNETVNFDAINNFCQAGSYVSPITGWSWDLGDGTVIADTNITHQYSTPGFYNVELSVSDNFGCVSTVSQQIEIKGLIAEIDDNLICPSASTEIYCNLADDGALYQWFLEGVAITSPTVNDTSITATAEGDYHVVMTAYDPSYNPCNTTSNIVSLTIEDVTLTLSAPDGTTICSGGSVNLTCNSIAGATQYEWFLGGVSQGTGTTNFTASSTGNYQVVVTSANGCDFASNIVALTSGTNPNATISASVNDICPGETSTLSTTLVGGETAQWFLNGNPILGATSSTYLANAAGTYHVEITNTAGCSDESSTEIIVLNPVPSPSVTSSEPNFCPGVTDIDLTASPSGAASYQWLLNGVNIGGAVSEIYTVMTPGDYSVMVTNAQGCSATSSEITLQNGSVSTFNLTADVTEFCDGDNANLNVNLESGSTYQWFYNGTSMGAGVLNQNSKVISNGGDYYVVVTNTLGCEAQSNTVTVIENALPAATISSADLSFCAGGSTQIDANFISGATYEWFLNGTSLGAPQVEDNSITVSTIGNYSVVINNGCSSASNSLNVTQQPLPSNAGAISGASTFCPGESFTYAISSVANAASYNWVITPASAASIGSGQGTTSVVINTTNQNFTISVTPQNECGNGGASNFSVTVNTAFMCGGQVLFAANKTNICQGSQVTFTNYTDNSVFFNTTMNWNFGAGASPATATGNGPHTVTYSTSGLKTVTLEYVDNFGGFVVADEIKTNYINVNGSVSTSAISGNNAISCAGGVEFYSVTNTAGSTYNWTVPSGATILTGQGSNAISVDLNGNQGTVSVVETTTAGCIGAAVNLVVTISDGVNTSAIVGTTNLQCNDVSEIYSVTGSVGSDYLWTVPAGAIILNGQGTDEIEVNFNGNFGDVTVVETNSVGCEGNLQSLNVSCVNAVDENEFTSLSVYPNPVSDVLFFSTTFSNEITIRIFDSSGKLILSEVQNSASNNQLDVSNLTHGIYFGELNSNGKIYRFKFVKN